MADDVTNNDLGETNVTNPQEPEGIEGLGGGLQLETPASSTNESGQITAPTGGEKTFTQAQVESMIKARIAEAKDATQKQYGDYDKFKKVASRIAQMTGSNVDDMEAELERIEAVAVAQQTGISPEVYQEIKRQKSKVDELEQASMNYKLDAEEAKLSINPIYKDALSKEEIRAEIREFAQKTGLTLEQAYWATQGSKGTQQMERDIEQRILASIENKVGKAGVISDSSSGVSDPTFGLSPEEVAFYNAQGDDLEEMAALKAGKNIDDFLKFKRGKSR